VAHDAPGQLHQEFGLSSKKMALLLGDGTMLVVDEVQKIPNWSESIKALWD
jgi:predicted AAA+ superfamily ATPase